MNLCHFSLLQPLFYYGPQHPMKPIRLKLTHHLILGYGLYQQMDCYRPHPANYDEMIQFHKEDYIKFLQKITPDNYTQFRAQSHKYNIGPHEDCPIFDGLYEFNQLLTGASMDAAVQLCLQETDVAINWSGGMHHTKKAEASGFCYVNGTYMCSFRLLFFGFAIRLRSIVFYLMVAHPSHKMDLPTIHSLDIVLAICELLKVYARVLYVDIDVHHGDGVEQAFYTTDRVMTLSLHKYGDHFFPETGHLMDKGAKEGQGYSLNVPLTNGITDDMYFHQVFQPIFDKIMQVFQPGAIFLQCGADSLAADKLGTFNLSTKGHARMVDYVKSKNIPLLVSGGGGYTIRNVARVWCYETAVLLGQHNISNEIPLNDFYEYFAPTYDLHLLPQTHMVNLNDPATIDGIRTNLLQQLQDLPGAPNGVSVMQVVPPLQERQDQRDERNDQHEDSNDDVGPTRKKTKRHHKKEHPSELYDSVD
jgi:histone deacetylase 1/2